MRLCYVLPEAVRQYNKDCAKGNEQWIPTPEEKQSIHFMRRNKGVIFPVFDEGEISGGVEGLVYLYTDFQPHFKSKVYAISPKYISFILSDLTKDVSVPVEPDKGWWTEKGLSVVRIKVEGFTDGFMAFTKTIENDTH